MPRLRVHTFSLSLDGYGAGSNQNIDNPFGEGGLRLTEWMTPTRTFQSMVESGSEGESGVDDDLVAKGLERIGATVMGRNMFGPQRGPWKDDSWTGWWGPNPPYHHPVFVLTHHARDPIAMGGGTTFNFVTEGLEEALRRAFDAADGLDVRLGGGVATIQSYLRAGLVDELHVAIAPILLGDGERLLDGLGDIGDRYECSQLVATKAAATWFSPGADQLDLYPRFPVGSLAEQLLGQEGEVGDVIDDGLGDAALPLRMTGASPRWSPRTIAGTTRWSRQVTMSTCRAGLSSAAGV